MSLHTVTMQLPERLYVRLQQTAQATKQSFEDILLRALQVGSPPSWETAPAEFQAELAALDLKLDSLYTAILSKLPKNRKEKLKNEQKEWIMERDDYCNTSRLVAGCLLDMYTKRINFLTKLNKVKD